MTVFDSAKSAILVSLILIQAACSPVVNVMQIKPLKSESLTPSPSPSPSPSPGTVARIYVKQVTMTDTSAPGGIRLLHADEHSPYFQSVANATSINSMSGSFNSNTQLLSGDGNYLLFSNGDPRIFDVLTSGNAVNLYRKKLFDPNEEAVLVNKDSSGNRFSISLWTNMNSISDDGRFIILNSDTALTASQTTNGFTGTNMFRKDLLTGTVLHVSDDTDTTNKHVIMPNSTQLSSDGRHVIYNNDNLIYRKDTSSGLPAEVVSKAANGTTNAYTAIPGSGIISMSGDGSKFLFTVANTSLVSPTGAGSGGLVLRDQNSNTNTIVAENISLSKTIISKNGSKVFIESYTALGGGVVSGAPVQVYSWSSNHGIELVTVNPTGGYFNQHSNIHSVSSDGRFVCLSTNASNAGIGNVVPSGGWMVIVKDTLTGEAIVADTDSTGSLSNGTFRSTCSLSADGKYIIFSSTDKNN